MLFSRQYMASSSKAPKNDKAAGAHTASSASPATPPSSPVIQPADSSKPAVPSSESSKPPVTCQPALAAEQSHIAADPQQPLPPQGTTAAFAQQLLALLKAVVDSNQSSQPAPKNAPLALSGPSDATKKEADVGRASRLECKTIREV